MNIDTPVLDPPTLARLHDCDAAVTQAAAAEFCAANARAYPGDCGPAACRGDFALMFDLLHAVLEFGFLQPLVEGLLWFSAMLAARGVERARVTAAMEQLAAGLAARLPAHAAGIVTAAMRKALLRANQAQAAEVPAWAGETGGVPEALAFEQALLAGDRAAARQILLAVLRRATLPEAERRLIQPALYRIGLRWQRNEVSVADEHLATVIVQSLMTEALLEAPLARSNGRRAVLACVDGNHHGIGLQMVADALQIAGWSVQCLGPNLPTPALLDHVAAHPADLLGLSLCFPQQLVHVREIMRGLPLSARPCVILGGLAVRQRDALVSDFGVDGVCADALEAVALAERLVGARRPA